MESISRGGALVWRASSSSDTKPFHTVRIQDGVLRLGRSELPVPTGLLRFRARRTLAFAHWSGASVSAFFSDVSLSRMNLAISVAVFKQKLIEPSIHWQTLRFHT